MSLILKPAAAMAVVVSREARRPCARHRPDGRVDGGLLRASETLRGSRDVLEEAQLPRAEHPSQLVQGSMQVRHRAQHQGDDRRIELAVAGGETVGDAGDDLDRHGSPRSSLLGQLPQSGSGSTASTRVTSGG